MDISENKLKSKMLPHAELDTYKLQIELLQEKLKRSEENRHKLEHKLENALHKKSEQEKIIRAKQRQKYQEFVGELEKRNERNVQLKKMLERIDQQTSALSARSERLRSMKMQYEMYFAKLVQSQTMRCLQGTNSNLTTAPTPIPIFLPATTPTTQQSAVITATPIKNNENDPMTFRSREAAATSSAIYQCDVSGNLIAAGNVLKPASYTLSPSSIIQEIPSCNTITPPQNAVPTASPLPPTAAAAALTASTQHWTLAMATPTPAGMLLTTTPTMGVIPPTAAASAGDIVSVPAYDYMPYPLGYLPRMRHLLQTKLNTPIHSDESDDLLQPMDANIKSNRYHHTNKASIEKDIDNVYPLSENNVAIDNDIRNLNHMDLPTRQLDNDKGEGALRAPKFLRNENDYEQDQRQRQKPEQLLSNMSGTSSASLLTLDKLPKTMTITEYANAENVDATTPIDERNNEDNDNVGKQPQLVTRFDESTTVVNNIGGSSDKGALPTSTTQRNDEEKILQRGVTDDSIVVTPSNLISSDNGNTIDADLRRKIDNTRPSMIPNQEQQHMTGNWQTTENIVTRTEATVDIKDNMLNNAEMTAGFGKYAENKVTNNSLSTGNDLVSTTTTTTTQNNITNTNANAKVSIEKIENEIYGELVNPPTGVTDKNDARNAAQGLVKELVTHQSENSENVLVLDTQNNVNVDYANYNYNVIEQPAISTDYEQSNSESYNPTYATIEGTTNAEVYQQPSADLAYTNDQNSSNNYDQYTVDPDAIQSQQDYSNVDYANYDASQYSGETVGYDPTAYPGYTYDATTGQYTADPTQQQYTNEDGTVTYDAQGGYEQQQYDTTQENQDYNYGNYTQEVDNSNVTYVDTTLAAGHINTQETLKSTPAIIPANTEPTIAPTGTVSKPTSILSTAEKHAMANEAQKKKKRVNFVDSSETDESSSVKPNGSNPAGAGSESDFDFSSSEKSGGNDAT